MLPQARPAAVEAAGRDSFRLVLAFFLPFFLPSPLRSVVSKGFRRSGLEPRDLVVLPEEFELTRNAGEPAPAGGAASSYGASDSELGLAMGAGGRPGMAAGLERSV